MTDVARVLKTMANAYMSAALARRVAGDVMRAAPLSALGAIGLVGVAAGLVWGRHRRHGGMRA